jgi:hypothetical protein
MNATTLDESRMRILRLSICLLCSVSGLVAQPDMAQEESPAEVRQSDIACYFALGLSNGGGFGEAVNSDLRDEGYLKNGSMVFFNAELGMEIKALDHLYFSPRIGWLHTTFNRRFDYPEGVDDLSVFSMLTCSAGGRYYLRETLPYLAYVQAEAGAMVTASKVSGIPFSSDALSCGVLAGYAYCWGSRSIGFEIGYRSIPVSHPHSAAVILNGRQTIVSEMSRKNFGGSFINVIWLLDLY